MRDRRLNLQGVFVVQVVRDVYGFLTKLPSRLYKYSDLNKGKITITELAAPLRSRSQPSLANFADEAIFVIGGFSLEEK